MIGGSIDYMHRYSAEEHMQYDMALEDYRGASILRKIALDLAVREVEEAAANLKAIEENYAERMEFLCQGGLP